MQSRRAVPFFPSSTRRAKKTRGASETTRQWYASNEFKSLPKEHVLFRKRRIPSLVFVLKKFSTGKEPPERVFFRERRAHKVASQKEDAKRLFGGRGRVSNLRERASRLLGKEYKGRQTELQFFSFLEFRVLEKRFESLNVFQAFLSSSY